MLPTFLARLLVFWTYLEQRYHYISATNASMNESSPRVERTGCYSQLDDVNGYLDSPHYPNSYPSGFDCCYDIARPSAKYCGIKLYAEEFRVVADNATSCQQDWLSMESCVPQGGSRLCGDLTGSTYAYLFQPGADALRFHFHSGNATTPAGHRYRLRYRALTNCAGLFAETPKLSDTLCYTQITDKRGSINTPYHPRHYPENVDCVYEFIRTDPFICGIRMRSITFQLEASTSTRFGDACSDFFQAPGCGFICGDIHFSWTALYQPGATSQKFHFHSDEETNMPGFLIAFEQLYHC